MKIDCTAELARFFLTFFQIFITDNDNFYIEFNNVWNNEIKPFIIKKFQIQKSGFFNLNSDILFFVQLIDETLKGKKIIKKIENKITKLKKKFTELDNGEIELKRTNSMIVLRPHSQTIDSKKTRDSSVKKDNSGLDKQSSKKIISPVKYSNDNKIDILDKEKQETNENNIIENKNEEKNDIDSNNEIFQNNGLTMKELLNKIINENYIYDNIKIIYYFCQQCFCFTKVETLFEQISNCYENIKKNSLNEQLNKLIEFTNVLVIEMILYYQDENNLDYYISIAKDFYYKLLSDLMITLNDNNNTYSTEYKNSINPIKIDDSEENQINIDLKKNNDNIKDYEIRKKNLIDVNLREENNSDFNYIEKDDITELRKSKSNAIKLSQLNEKNLIKEIRENHEEAETMILSLESKTLRKSQHLSLHKNKLKETIKEEDEKKEESDDDKEKINSKILCESNLEEKTLKINPSIGKNKEKLLDLKKGTNSQEEKELKEKNEGKLIGIIGNIMKKVNISEDIVSIIEEELSNLKYIIIIFEKAEKHEENIDIYINEIKKKINFYNELQKKIKRNIKYSLNPRQRNKRMTKTYSSSLSSFSSKKTHLRYYLSKGYFCITDWKTEEIGNQLMMLSKNILNKIRPRELYKAVYLKKDKEFTSPNVVDCINKFNRLTSFVMEDILSYNRPKDRAKVYEKWVLIADYCKENKDYNDLIAIFSAFNHYIITGLKLTLKEVKSKTNSILNKIRNFCSIEGNYKNIREDMDTCDKNGQIFIPYLGMLLRDINFFEEKAKYIDEKGFINFEKIDRIHNMFELYFKFKNKDEDKSNKIQELEFFNDLNDITEEELETIANDLEPEFKLEVKQKKKKRPTNIDEKYFFKYKSKDDNNSEDMDNNGEDYLNNEPQDLDTAFCN